MTRSQPKKTSQLVRQIVSFGCAVFLPILAILFTQRTPSLSGMPFALSLTAIAAVGISGGPGPAIVAILVTALFESFYGTTVFPHTSLLGHLFRKLVLFGAAGGVTFLIWKKSTTEKRLRAALEDLQERTDSLMQAQRASLMASWFFRSDTMETFWDAGSYPVFGRPFEDLANRALPLEYLHEEDRDSLREHVEHAIRTGSPIAIEFRVILPNGEIRWLESRGTRLIDQPHCWRGVTLDITRRKVVETALIRSEKLAAMGRLASTVAHEVNNPLESVTNILYLVGVEENLSPAVRSYLALAEEELARLSNITRLTLTFARPHSLRTRVTISSVLDDVLNIYQRRCELLGVTIERCYEPGLTVEIQPHELRQIAINLIANALDALNTEKRLLRLRSMSQAGRAVFFVEDSGSGIAEADLQHVFDAFFTTKSDVGTGIGLWVTHELVMNNSGVITVESGDFADGIRTRFRVELPLTCAESREPAVISQAEIPPPKGIE